MSEAFASSPSKPLDAASLAKVLDRLRPLMAAPAVVNAPSLTSATLDSALGALRPLLQEARRGGAFLNVWAVAGLRRDEVRTSGVLAWLLDPNGSHGCGDAWLQAFWQAAHAGAPPFELTGARGVATEVTPMGNAADRIDIAIEGDDFVVYVEVKIDAGLQPDQLQRYRAGAEAKARLQGRRNWLIIFLAGYDAGPLDGCVRLSWRDVARAIETASAALPRDAVGVIVARQFAAHVAKLH